jgi:DNA mismatch repair protein MSH6
VNSYPSTHYHELTEQFSGDERIRLYHMGILDPTDTQPLTFLYKLTSGRCSKSHGFNAARCAGVPEDVITLAKKMAEEMEEKQTAFNKFREIFAL